MPIILSDIQERVERSIYEVIRLLLVDQGYLPDVRDDGAFPKNGVNLTQSAQALWNDALTTIKNAKDFATEVFNHSSSEGKGLKRVPRIAIIPRRIMPGDIGLPVGGTIVQNPLDPNNFTKYQNPPESADLHIDIHLVSNTTKQDRFLNAIIAKAIGTRRFIKMYDNPNEGFWLRQFNYYDLPDTQEGIQENVYSFEAQDLYLFDGGNVGNYPVSLIKEITMETTIAELGTILTQSGSIIGPYVNDGSLFIDLSGIHFNH